jgi:cytochrome c5
MNTMRCTVVFSVALFLASGAAYAADPAQGSAKALFEAKCSICHPLSRPLGKTKNKAGWTATVTRMKKVNGCPITDEEAQRIIGYLAEERGPKGN